jgi:hypothetical protein
MDKSAAIRLMPGTAVLFRGRRHSIVNAKTGMQPEAPFFRLRDLDDGGVTGLISYKLLELMPEECTVKAKEPGLDPGLEPGLEDFDGREI